MAGRKPFSTKHKGDVLCIARMSYDEKLTLVKYSVLEDFRKRITDNWEKMFDMWLSCEADMEFGHGYQDKFKEHFSKYMNTEVESKLWFMGGNVVCAISAFMNYKDEACLEDILDFTEQFVSSQMDSFTNWSDHISMAMYEESSDCERETKILNSKS